MRYFVGDERDLLYIQVSSVRLLEPTVNWGGLDSWWTQSKPILGRHALSDEPTRNVVSKMDKMILCNFTSAVIMNIRLCVGC